MNQKMIPYAGIGSRETPPEALLQMTKIASILDERNWVLRSGGAQGADQAFENGAKNHFQIFLPWGGFENKFPQKISPTKEYTSFLTDDHYLVAERYHPKWNILSQGVRKMMARNTAQVLGRQPRQNGGWSKLVICWTPGAQITGGTGQAMRIAHAANIPIVNLADPAWPAQLEAHVATIEKEMRNAA